MHDSLRRVLRAAAALMALGALLMPSLAHAQGAQVYQSGLMTPGHLAKFVSEGRIADAGGLNGDSDGNGLGPFSVIDKLSIGFCTNTGPTTKAYNAFCLGHDANGNALMSVDSYNGFGDKALFVRLNGTSYSFPGAGNGNVIGPTSPAPTAGNIVVWNGGTAVKDGGATLYGAKAYGAKGDGTTDDTTAVQACLTAAAAGGTCIADKGKYLILGGLTIPAHTSLKCGDTDLDAEVNPIDYGTLPAIILDSGHSIIAGGAGVGIHNCLIYRRGMVFPPTDGSNSFAGTAIQEIGKGNLWVTGSTIIGFDSAIYTTGTRPYVQKVYADGSGINHGVIDVANSNTDSGFFYDIKIQPLATGNGDCIKSRRPGIGFRAGGINFFSNIVSQNFGGAQFLIDSYAIASGTLWADDIAASCPGTSSTGLLVRGNLDADQININSVTQGIVFIGGGPTGGATSRIGSLFLNNIKGDCVDLGGTDPLSPAGNQPGGIVEINYINTNQGNAPPNCTNYVVNYRDTSFLTAIAINGGAVINNGGFVPYFKFLPGTPDYRVAISEKILAQAPGDVMPQPVINSIDGAATPPTGLGTGAGTGTLLSSSVRISPWVQAINIQAGTGAATTGQIAVTWPFAKSNAAGCKFGLQNDTGTWPAPTTIMYGGVSTTSDTITWTVGTPFVAGKIYHIEFRCDPR